MKKLLLLGACLLGLFAFAIALARQWWYTPPGIPEAVVFEVGRGSALVSVAEQLHAQGLLDRPGLWRWIARLKGLDNQVKRGEYLFRNASPAELLAAMVAGNVRRYRVTFPEGITLAQAIAELREQEPLVQVLSGRDDPRLLQMVAPAPDPEGGFFPDTYSYVRGDTDLSILARARARLESELEAAWQGRAPDLPYNSPFDALIMASIIEKETGHASERDRIAGVFVRRLQKRMKLQTDPTVIYGLGESYGGDLLRKHLDDPANPYNTYRHRGLPPGPIALPGAEAIRAAMHPAPGTELYFVARGDGSHQFSDTLAQHQAAVRKYQLSRREDYRSSPGKGDGR